MSSIFNWKNLRLKSKWRNLGLQTKILSIIALLIILPIAGTSYYLFTIERPAQISRATENMDTQVNSIVHEFSMVINDQNEFVHTIRDTPAIDQYFNSEISERDNAADFVAAMLLAFSRHTPWIAQARMIDANGFELVRINIDINRGEVEPGAESDKIIRVSEENLQDKSSSSYFSETKTLTAGGEYISHINLNRESGEIQIVNADVVPVIRHATPIYIENTFMGIIVVNFYIQPIFDLIAERLTSVFTSSQFTLVDSNNYLFNTVGDEWTSIENLGTGSNLIEDHNIEANFLSNEGGQKVTNDEITVAQLVDIEFFDTSFKLYGVMITPTSFVTSSIDSTLSFIILVIFVGGFLGAVIAYFVVRDINKNVIDPIAELGTHAGKIANGDLSEDIKINGARTDEIGLLKNNFQLMQQKVRFIITSTQEAAEILSTGSEDLLSGSEEINASAEEVASTSQAMSNGATSQTEMITEVNDDIQKTQKLVIEIIKKIQANTTDVSQIALQTNILALNAGIEASRAGDYGRGFMVVAENVRKLSDQSKTAAEKIALVADEIGENLQNSFNSLLNSMSNIVSVSEETAASAEEVAAAAEEMTATVDQLSANAQQLADQAETSNEMISQFIISKT